MKKFLVLGAVALLAACGSKPDTTAPAGGTTDAAMGAASAPAMGEASAPAMAAEAPKPGVYDVTDAAGTKVVSTILADGGWIDRDAAGKVVAKGKYALKDGKTCFTDEKGKEDCYTAGTPGADGVTDYTGADGKVTKVAPHKKK